LTKKTQGPKEKLSHRLMGEHIVLSEEEKQKVLSKYNADLSSFPAIFLSDPALVGLNVKPGDMILIKRKDFTGEYDYYRVVIKG
jgi:DNA-directed RNA polymerase subunit H